jgi:hypothetical protein
MAKAKEVAISLVKSLNEIARDNLNINQKEKLLNILKNLIGDYHNLLLEEKNLKTNKGELEIKINKLREELRLIEKKIAELEDSSEYQKSLEENKSRSEEKDKLEKEIYNIKQKIDFKFLAKHFHGDEKKVKIIKKYSDNFRKTLNEDGSLEIIPIVKEVASINLENLAEIKNRIDNIKNLPLPQPLEKEKNFKEDIKEKEYEIKETENKIIQESKILDKLREKGENLINNIKEQAKNIK